MLIDLTKAVVLVLPEESPECLILRTLGIHNEAHRIDYYPEGVKQQSIAPTASKVLGKTHMLYETVLPMSRDGRKSRNRATEQFEVRTYRYISKEKVTVWRPQVRVAKPNKMWVISVWDDTVELLAIGSKELKVGATTTTPIQRAEATHAFTGPVSHNVWERLRNEQ